MKEPDFDGSSLEQPDTEPEAHDATADARAGDEPGTDDAGTHDSGAPDSGSQGSEEEVLYVRKGSLRRRPKFAAFGVLGGLVGLIGGLVLAQVGAIPAEQDYTRLDLSIVLVGLGVPAGILLALLIALILERRSK